MCKNKNDGIRHTIGSRLYKIYQSYFGFPVGQQDEVCILTGWQKIEMSTSMIWMEPKYRSVISVEPDLASRNEKDSL